MRKIFLIGMAVALVMVGALGFVTTSEAAKTIKIAAMEPLSGTFKDIGDRYVGGLEYAVKVINEGGGLLGRKVELIPVDTELKPDVATRKATKLIMKDNVKFFVGGTGSSVGGAMSILAEKNNALMVSYGMAASSLTGEKCSKNFFRTCLSTDQQSYAAATWVAKSGFKKIAIIAQDYSFGHEAVEGFIKKVKELNPAIEITVKLYHKIGEKDYAPYLSQIISSNPELVFTSNWGNDLSLLMKQAKTFGLKAKFATYYLNDEHVIAAIGSDEAVLGSVAVEQYMLTVPRKETKEFVDGFYKARGYYPTAGSGKAYGSLMFLAAAIKKAGTDDIDAVIKAFEGLTMETIGGTWYMRPCDHQNQGPIWIGEVVKESPFFKHPYVGAPTMVSAEEVAVSCEATGCTRIKK